jgi:phosphatidylglycerophosphatase A
MTERPKIGALEIGQKFFITAGFSGYLPVAPGSWGSLVACLLLWFFWPGQWYFQLIIIAAFYPVAVYFADVGIRYFGPDGRRIVIDEVMGQAITLFMVPHNAIAYIIAFVTFRVFDVVKPQPARNSEKIAGGRGVVADDMIAGAYSLITLQLIIALLSKWGVKWT